jgi:hypothetical protein
MRKKRETQLAAAGGNAPLHIWSRVSGVPQTTALRGIGFNLKKRFQSLRDDLELGIITFLL